MYTNYKLSPTCIIAIVLEMLLHKTLIRILKWEQYEVLAMEVERVTTHQQLSVLLVLKARTLCKEDTKMQCGVCSHQRTAQIFTDTTGHAEFDGKWVSLTGWELLLGTHETWQRAKDITNVIVLISRFFLCCYHSPLPNLYKYME